MTPSRFGRPLLAALLASALAAGCAAGRPKTRFFTLGTIAPEAGAAIASRPDLGLAVGPIEFPRYLDRPEIVTRDGAHRLVLSNANRWAGSLRSDVLRVVADDLGVLLGTARITVFPNEPTFPLDYRVLLDLRELEGVPGDSVVLRARWTVVSGATGKAVAVEEAHVVEPAGAGTIDDYVAAQRLALARVSRDIATRIAGLPAPAVGAK